MKFRILVLTSLTVLFCKLVSAQETNWGLKAGANLSTLTTDLNGEKYLLGYHFGGFAEFKLSEKLFIQPEMLYSLEGAKIDDSFSFQDEGSTFGIDYKETVKLTYLQLPVIIKYRFAERLNFEFGPQLGLLLNAKSDYDVTIWFDDEQMSESGSEKIKAQIKSLAFGLNFGLGYEFNNNMFVQGRYHLGLSNIDDSDDMDEDVINRGSIKNRSFQISIGYKF